MFVSLPPSLPLSLSSPLSLSPPSPSLPANQLYSEKAARITKITIFSTPRGLKNHEMGNHIISSPSLPLSLSSLLSLSHLSPSPSLPHGQSMLIYHLKLKSAVLCLGVRRMLEGGGGVRFLGVKCWQWGGGGPGFEVRGAHCFRI